MEWKYWPHDDCPECGGSVEVFTDAIDGMCYDGDSVRCMDCELRSGISVYEDGSSMVQDT